MDGDRRERGQRLPPALRGDGEPELADDERFTTHLARGDNQEELEGIVAEWAGRHDAGEIDRVLNEAGVICGPIYTIADIFEDPQFQRARDAARARRPGVRRRTSARESSPSSPRRPGRCAGRRPWEEGSHNREVYGELLGLSDDELDALKSEGVI